MRSASTSKVIWILEVAMASEATKGNSGCLWVIEYCDFNSEVKFEL